MREGKPRKPWIVKLLWAATLTVALPVVYVLSYAPVTRVFVGTGVSHTDDLYIAAYKPALFLIWKSPLRMPLLRWAELWGVRHVAERHAYIAANW